jgi:hypothetical protein
VGNGYVDLRILDLDYLDANIQLPASAALPPGKIPRYPLDRRLDGPQNQSRRRGEEKILPLPGLELHPSAVEHVTSRHTGCVCRTRIKCYTLDRKYSEDIFCISFY